MLYWFHCKSGSLSSCERTLTETDQFTAMGSMAFFLLEDNGSLHVSLKANFKTKVPNHTLI